MLENLPLLALEKIISLLDFESRQNLVKSSKNNELLNNKLQNFETQIPCPFCVFKRLSGPPMLILWKKLGIENDDASFEAWLRLMTFCTDENIAIKSEKQWLKYDVTNYEDKLNSIYIDDDLNDISFETMIHNGYFDHIFTTIFSAPYVQYNDYNSHLLSHFRLCYDEQIGPIQSEAKMNQVIENLGHQSEPFVDPEIYETIPSKKKIRLETRLKQNIREDMQQVIVRLTVARFLYQAPDFFIGKRSSQNNIELAKFFNKKLFELLTDIRFLSDPCTHLKLVINNNRLLTRILSRI